MVSYDEVRLQRFREIVRRYNINYDFAFRLRALEGFDVVMILDDSSSMRTPVIDRTQTQLTPFDPLPTRWDELKHIVSVIVDLASTVNSDGIDIYFLNRQPLLRVTDASQLDETFSHVPNGPTPLTPVLRYVFNVKRSQIHDRKLLVLIATDGLPTDNIGRSDLLELEKALRYERNPSMERMLVTFLACTNDLDTVGYLNQLDKKIPFVDVLDDYHSERAEVIAAQGRRFAFSYGDYVVKLLLGSIDRWFDHLDERKVKAFIPGQQTQQRKRISSNSQANKRNCTIS